MSAPRVALAISSFRNDDSVEALLRAAVEVPLFERILVVDSLGTGRLPAVVEGEGWGDRVDYHSAERNLGSAGNLSLRLQRAADAGFDYVYAINHDGVVDGPTVEALLRFAAGRQRLGAVFPLRFLATAGRFDLTGTRGAPMPRRMGAAPPPEASFPVSWYSSNPALYALVPVREGLRPWADLWMGWEDLGYGWLLEAHGYEQHIVTAARIDDNYEYRTVRFLGRPLQISDKASWYAYYQLRNLVLVTRRNRRPVGDHVVLGLRLAQETFLTLAYRDDKRRRLHLLYRGLFDGLRGRAGKGPVP